MKVRIWRENGPRDIEADVVEAAVAEDGDLKVTTEDRDGTSGRWVVVARGAWSMVEQIEGPTPEVVEAVTARLNKPQRPGWSRS